MQTKFGRLTILGIDMDKSIRGRKFLRCLCDCGIVKSIGASGVYSGVVVSCGCNRDEQARATGLLNRTHGLSSTPEYFVHHHLIDRCYNPKNPRWDRYGGRGIAVCERWRGKDGLAHFYADLGPRPSSEYSIERIDNEIGGYWCGKCPECITNNHPANCIWDTVANQSRNNSRTRILTCDGKTQCLKDWAKEIGISPPALRKRLSRMTIENAIRTPKFQQN